MSEVARRNATGIATLSTNEVHQAQLFYRWTSEDPLVVEMEIQIAFTSAEVTSGEFPEGLSCMQCHEPINNGAHYVPVHITPQVDELWCVTCGMGQPGSSMENATWFISAELIAQAVDPDYTVDRDPERVTGAGRPVITMVRVQRRSPTELRFTFTEGHNTMYLVTKVDALLSLVQEIRAIGRATVGGKVEAQYLETGIDSLEAFANGMS